MTLCDGFIHSTHEAHYTTPTDKGNLCDDCLITLEAMKIAAERLDELYYSSELTGKYPPHHSEDLESWISSQINQWIREAHKRLFE